MSDLHPSTTLQEQGRMAQMPSKPRNPLLDAADAAGLTASLITALAEWDSAEDMIEHMDAAKAMANLIRQWVGQ